MIPEELSMPNENGKLNLYAALSQGNLPHALYLSALLFIYIQSCVKARLNSEDIVERVKVHWFGACKIWFKGSSEQKHLKTWK
jgi:hypothetical protein